MNTEVISGEKGRMEGVRCPACGTGHLPRSIRPQVDKLYASTCEDCGNFFKFRIKGSFKTTASFTVNGHKYTVGNEYSSTTTLNDFLRKNRISTGTKYMCRTGGCGACVVAVKRPDPIAGSNTTVAMNSCLCPLFSCDGWEITTVEGLGNKREGYNEIQQKIAEYNGSQCGYCTPGQVMNMYALKEANPSLTKQQVEDSFDGQICRCTGYRSILDAFKSMAANDPPDIEDVVRTSNGRPKTSCAGGSCRKPEIIRMVLADAQWYRPTTMEALYDIIAANPTKKIRFTVGNTATGVHSDLGPWNYDVIVDIKGIVTLYMTDLFPTEVFIGAALTLSQLMTYFRSITSHPGFQYLEQVAEYLGNMANLPVRNAGSWAGNLMIKNNKNSFPSDVFTALETIGAGLTVGGPTGNEPLSLIEFLQTDMTRRVINFMMIPGIGSDFFIRLYKVSPRHQVHATQTESYLVGKNLGDPTTLKGALDLLNTEIVPETHRVAGSPAYRKSVALALFYRYVLSVVGDKSAPFYKSGGSELQRPISSGQQSYGTDKAEWPLTEPIPKITSLMQASGEAEYISDIEPHSNEVYAAFVLSTQGNATLGTMDASQSLAYPGVLKFITYQDIPEGGVNNAIPAYAGDPEEILCSKTVLYAGQPVGIIVAETQDAANVATGLVKVSYTDQQPVILTIDQAIQAKSFFDTGVKDIVAGNAEAAIAQSAHQLSGTINCGDQYHFTMETQVAICRPTDEGVDVFASTQFTDGTQQSVAQVLGLSSNKVHVEVKRIGGAYGSKITRNFAVSAGAALASYVMNRPARMKMDLETNMEMIGKRWSYKAEYQVGFTEQGMLNGIQISYYGNAGCSPNDMGVPSTMWFGDNCYYCENWHMIPYAVKTNTPSTTPCRAPGSTPGIFIIETIMEHIAESLNVDPTQLKYQNLYQQGQVGLERFDGTYRYDTNSLFSRKPAHLVLGR